MKAKFFILCDVIFVTNLKWITLGSERDIAIMKVCLLCRRKDMKGVFQNDNL